MSRRFRTRAALAAATTAVAALPVLPSSGTASANYDPCDAVFLDWVYEDPADMMWDFTVCIFWGISPDGPAFGTSEWIDDHSA